MNRFRLSVVSVCGLALLTGCGVLGGKDMDYQSAAKRETPLEVPPDLVRPAKDERFALPASGVASRAEFERQQSGGPRPAAAAPVLPAVSGMRIERMGEQRVLIVNQAPEKLWPVLRQFWLDAGFAIATESPETGLLETDWAEDRAKIPEDFLRRTLGKVFDRLYDTGERDKFRMRVDRLGNGESEISVSHRGLLEIASTSASDSKTTWTNRPSDLQLEADFLRRIMLRLGADENRAKSLLAEAAPAVAAANMSKTAAGSQIDLAESFDRAWRRVGVAIDRLGFTVEDRDRAKGIFYVRYRDPTAQVEDKKGFFGRIFSSSASTDPVQYQVSVTGQANQSVIRVLNKTGQPINDANAQRVLTVLFEQLK
jgi:outer membrane protein assembly factor BamC